MPGEIYNNFSSQEELIKISCIFFFDCFLEQIDDELFNPDYVEVDRIMDFSRSTDDNGEVNRTSNVFVFM